MSDPFFSSKYSIERAKHHLNDFKAQIIEFFKTEPYSTSVEIDPDTGEEIHKIKLVNPLPPALPGIAFDTVNNLRSALDQSLYAVNPQRDGFFPFASDATNFENAVKGRCKTLPEEIVNLLRAFKPYKGGNNLLWALNELCNANKHAIIRPVAMRAREVLVEHLSPSGGRETFPAPVWDRTENEMVLCRRPPGSRLDIQLTASSFIAICDIEFLDGKPADGILNKIVGIVEGVVSAIEAEARRIGIV